MLSYFNKQQAKPMLSIVLTSILIYGVAFVFVFVCVETSMRALMMMMMMMMRFCEVLCQISWLWRQNTFISANVKTIFWCQRFQLFPENI